MKNPTFKIDPEFEALIPPLAGDELTRLAKALQTEGIREPILVWATDDEDVIVDGHNRYKIAQDLGLAYRVRRMHFAGREAAKTWIFANQIARRNLGQDQITLLAVWRGIAPPNSPTPKQIEDAHLVAADADFCGRVLRSDAGWSLRAAANAIRARTRTPRQATAPSGNPDRPGGSNTAPVAAVTGGVGDSPPDATDVAAARLRLDASRAAADVKILQRRLVEAEKATEFYDSIASAKPIVVSTRPKSGKRQGTLFTCASDWHVGEVVTAEETHGRNTYDLAEARRRAGNFWDNVLWLRKDVQRTVSSDDHVLNLNGDMISGSIHQELAETNEVGLVEQVGEAISMIEPGIRALAPECRRLVIPCVHGNHGRFNHGKSLVKIGWAVSLEAMLYRWLRDKLSDIPNIEWCIPKAESVALEVMGYKMRFQHGTHLKSQGGIGGILVPLTRWAVRQNTADYYVFGHFHQACAFGRVIVNGSLIGESAYSTENGFEYRPPEQINWIIDSKRGMRRFDPVSVT